MTQHQKNRKAHLSDVSEEDEVETNRYEFTRKTTSKGRRNPLVLIAEAYKNNYDDESLSLRASH